MSKRKHKSKKENNDLRRRMQQTQNTSPFGINPAQLLSMFGNIDMNQINNMLQNISRDGIDFNKLNLGMLQNFMGNPGGSTNMRYNDNMSMNYNTEDNGSKDIENNDTENRKVEFDIEDENMELLRNLRKIVSSEKVPFVDKIIQLYSTGVFKD